MLQANLFRRRARVAFTTNAKRYGYVLATIVHIALLSNLQPCRSNLGRDVTPNSRERKIDITTAPCAGQVLGFEAPADKCPAHHFSETRQRDHKDDAATHGGPFFIFGRGSVVLMRVFFSFFFGCFLSFFLVLAGDLSVICNSVICNCNLTILSYLYGTFGPSGRSELIVATNTCGGCDLRRF